MVADVYNTTVNVNGNNVFSSSWSLGSCCCNRMYTMNSCFGFGYGGMGCGLGMGLGFAAGMALAPAMPAVFKGIGKAFGWFGSKVIAPAATGVFKGVIKPFYKGVIAPIGEAIGSIFRKKSKSKSKNV